MADRVFCIDFGSAYTKVALRRDPSANGQLVSLRTGGAAEVEFCIPTAVAIDRRGSRPVPEFGSRAAGLAAGGGVDVYRNWKRSLFLPAETSPSPHPSPLEALLHSDDFSDLAARFNVPAAQVGHLQAMVVAAKNLIVGPGGRVASPESQQHKRAVAIAPHFFLWLRQQVLDECSRLPTAGLRYDAIPARVTVPAFESPGSAVLLESLGKAGWPLHPENPTVPEPYANAIGVLTKGINVFHHGRVRIGDMFGRCPLITVMKDATHHPSYRAVVIDVGAFTTDFAAVTLSPEDDNSSDPDAAVSLAQTSIAVGVSDLDQKVIAALPKEKADWLRSATALDWEDFRPAAYTEGKGVRKADLGIIGGPADAEAIKTCLTEFGYQLSEETAKFMAGLPHLPAGAAQEIILTGGGNFIPAVRDAIRTAAGDDGKTYVKTHAPALKRAAGGPSIDRLDTAFTRGGSALGGASIYFEKSLY